MEEEFQFLRCSNCQTEGACPKLLSCMHTLCSSCLEANGPKSCCPVCSATLPLGTNNLLFESLQRRIDVYRKIIGTQEAVCDCCKQSADFWCFECEQLICSKCFEAHKWFLKHEARKMEDLRRESAKDFLEATRKTNNLFCPNPHPVPILTSIYCRGCSKPICCSCALLDSTHKDQYCAISVEIQLKQEELVKMTQTLRNQRDLFDVAHRELQSAAASLSQVQLETQELIRSKVRLMIEQIQDKERELLEMVDQQYRLGYEEMARKLAHTDAVLKRIRAGELIVEKMQLYASDQEVLEMYPFIQKALEGLQREIPMDMRPAVQVEFEECKAELQALFARVTEDRDAADPDSTHHAASGGLTVITTDSNLAPSSSSTLKRKAVQTSISFHGPRKAIKEESGDRHWKTTNDDLEEDSLEQPGPSSSQPIPRQSQNSPLSPGQGSLVQSPDPIVVISSSEDTDDDTVVSGLVTHTPRVHLAASPAHTFSASDAPGWNPLMIFSSEATAGSSLPSLETSRIPKSVNCINTAPGSEKLPRAPDDSSPL
ncbi:protein PML isoform X2 [Tachyglossus aculeatus]|uniref:protein PML isoform X2 n=1 Tax=Tachyglossus aculeatus TaxID=9261 RepID=UPI0018F2FBE6|nr:protein PML isoform X2 [Tachyglossus aculeatus]